jgi:pyrimidine operon attenuation protein/uracil phosphoribosyltransferase
LDDLVVFGKIFLLFGASAMKKKAEIMDSTGVARAMARITHEIIERNQGAGDICLLGVKSRGVPLSRMLAENIKRFEGVEVPVGLLDITRHRDDLSFEEKQAAAIDCHIPCDVRDKTVILVDDVIYTGRTVRAAMEAVFSHSRPKAIQLAVLIDRGHRELPIRPDYVGKNVPTAQNERIAVLLEECDGQGGVFISTSEEE